MLEMWFKESLTFRFVLAFLEAIKTSFIGGLIERAGEIIVNSKVASCLRFIATRPFKPKDSFFYRLAESVNRRSTGFRERMAAAMKESRFYKLLFNSKSFPLIELLLIPMVAFYPFIDEIGRDLLGGFYLFGLWDELYLLVCAFYVFAIWFFKKREEPLISTPAGPPILLLISVSLCLYLINSTYPQLGFEGFRVVIQYILWFFVLNSYLTDDKKAYLITRLLVYAGGIMGIHGLIQYILKVPTPESWTDYAEGSTGTRVFSIVGSPNILGSIFILMIPLCMALLLQKRRSFRQIGFPCASRSNGAKSCVDALQRCLAWSGHRTHLFCLAVNPRCFLFLVPEAE